MLPSIYNRRNFQINKPSSLGNAQKLPVHESSLIYQHIAKLSETISSLSAALEGKMKEGQAQLQFIQNARQQQQQRFKIIEMPLFKIKEGQDRRFQIKKFIADSTSCIFSQAFHYFEQNKLTEKKYRLFCCHNLLYNLIKFGQLNKLSLDELQQIDNHLKKNVLIFLKCKYPQSESTESNLKLASMITDINNLNSNSNDYIGRSRLMFQKKQSGNYSQQIMGLINHILNMAKVEILPQKSLYKRFFQEMTDIFTNIESEQWVLLAKSGIFSNKVQKSPQNEVSLDKKVSEQKYRQKVQQYTKYLIGKKLSDNISVFSQSQLKQENLSVKNPAVMRVLTKWCQQLQDIFNTNESILQREQMFRMRDGSQRYLEREEKQILIQCLNEQKQVLNQFLSKLKQNIYENQLSIISSNTPQQIFRQFCSEFQSCVGYVTSLFVNSNQNYLLSYLNKLIDCILQAEQEWVRRMRHGAHFRQEIPSLITFRIGDLFRCKCASKESEVTAIFAYLKELSSKKPDVLEIIRVKNRLNQGTKDILINFKYLNTVTAQMQLSVNQDKSNFIKCSDKANHFLYELERASFGPFSQMANISANLDERFNFYYNQFQKINQWSQNKIQKNTESSISCTHVLEEFNLPVWCSDCKTFSPSYNLVIPHQKCAKCNLRICSKCLVAEGKSEHIKPTKDSSWIEFNRMLGLNLSKLGKIEVIDLQKKAEAKILVVKKLEDKTIIFQFDEEEQTLTFDQEIKKDREIYQFSRMGNSRKLLTIFKIEKDEQKKMERMLKISLIKRNLEQVRKSEKKTFVYENRDIDDTQVFDSFVLRSVQKVSLMSTKLQDLHFLARVFPNCERMVLNNSSLKKFDQVCDLIHLKQLQLQDNKISSIPQELSQLRSLQILNLNQNNLQLVCENLCSIKSLKSLKLQKNKIKQVSPKIAGLENIQTLWLKSNHLKAIPDELGNLSTIKILVLEHNELFQLPSTINNLFNLQMLNIANNKISQLNQDIFCNMSKLKDFYGYQNSFTNIPSSIKFAISLTKFSVIRNKIQTLPLQLKQLKNLSIVNLMDNPLKNIQIGLENINNESITDLNLSSIQLTQLPTKMLLKMTNIKIFSFYNNNVTDIPPQIGSLKKLERLWMGSNRIALLPNQICLLKDLKALIVNKNKLNSLPKKIVNLKRLEQLDIEANQMTEFPKQICSIPSLNRLYAGENRFKEIPSQIGQLRKLRQLGLYSNSLKMLPTTMENLKNLEMFEVNQNILDEHSQPISNQIMLGIFKKKRKN